MKMYIGNCTQQYQDFMYRVTGIPAPRMQRIDIGGQIQISGDLTSEEIDYIVEQHARYGLVHVSEVDRTKPFIGMTWDTKPIAVAKLRSAAEHNNAVLTERGREIRRETAVAINNSLEEQAHGQGYQSVEFSVTEEKGGTMEHDPLSEGIRVTRDAPMTPAPAPKRRRA